MWVGGWVGVCICPCMWVHVGVTHGGSGLHAGA